jgi:GT2 family glycosyltransferase
MKLVSIVILNWNGKSFLEQFLPTLIKHTKHPDAEIVVADNGSTDDSMEFMEKEFPSIRTLRLEKNHGFSGGYNRALEQIDSTYYLLLNSDIEVCEGWLDPLLKEMEENERVAACTPKILNYHQKTHFEYAGAAGGFIDRFGYPFCRGRIFDAMEEDLGQYDESTEIFWGTGACLMIRSELWKEVGGLDDLFFAHMEEIDLCWRLKRMGHVILSVPSSKVYHVGGGTLERGNPMKTFLNFRNNLLLLHKNLPPDRRASTLFIRKIFDGISALRFLLQGAFKDFWAVLRAHRAFYGMKKSYRGTNKLNKTAKNGVIVSGIYPGSIVTDFFLRGKNSFQQLDQEFRQKQMEQ